MDDATTGAACVKLCLANVFQGLLTFKKIFLYLEAENMVTLFLPLEDADESVFYTFFLKACQMSFIKKFGRIL